MRLFPSRDARTVCVSGLAIAALAMASRADAAMLTMDINTVTATFSGASPFGTSVNGTVTITENANTYLAGIRIDETDQGSTGVIATLLATINLSAGVVSSGNIFVELTDGSTYSATIESLSGSVKTQAGQGFMMDGLTFSGTFGNLVGGSLFGGVDVSAFAGGSLPGSFLHFGFNPGAQGVDTNTDLEVYVIPSPAGSLALLGVLLAATRRRRA